MRNQLEIFLHNPLQLERFYLKIQKNVISKTSHFKINIDTNVVGSRKDLALR